MFHGYFRQADWNDTRLTLGLTNGQTQALDSVAVLLPIVAGLLLLWTFARGERRDRPLVPSVAWRDRRLLTGSAVGFTLTFTTTAGAVLLTLYLQQIEGVSASATGWLFVPFSVAVVVGASLGSRLVSRRGAVRPMRWGLIGIAVSQGIHIAALEFGSVAGIVAGLALSGLTLGVASVASTSHGLAASEADAHGVASGLLNAAARVGTAVGIVAATTRSIAPGEEITATVTGYPAAHLAGILLILASVAVIRKPSRRSSLDWLDAPPRF